MKEEQLPIVWSGDVRSNHEHWPSKKLASSREAQINNSYQSEDWKTLKMSAADNMKRIADMVSVLKTRRSLVEIAEQKLSEAQAELRTIEYVDFPELMRECELKEVILSDGTKLKLEDEVRCSISKNRRTQAHAWLNEHGFGGLIKRTVEIPLGRGDTKMVNDLLHKLVELGYLAEHIEHVHPQTLKSFVKEQIEKGSPVPQETFGVFIQPKVTTKEQK